jgi:transposase
VSAGTEQATLLALVPRDSAMSRVEVLSGPERRRRWSADQKRSIVAEAFAPGSSVCEAARRRELVPGKIYRWRNELRTAAAGFTAVVVAPALARQLRDDRAAASLLPQPFEHQRRPDLRRAAILIAASSLAALLWRQTAHPSAPAAPTARSPATPRNAQAWRSPADAPTCRRDGSRRFADRRAARPRSCGRNTSWRLHILVRTQSRDSRQNSIKIEK